MLDHSDAAEAMTMIPKRLEVTIFYVSRQIDRQTGRRIA
jgi:hypothetical protein